MPLYPKSVVLFVSITTDSSTSAFISGIVSILGSISGESIFSVLLRVDRTKKQSKDVFEPAPMHHFVISAAPEAQKTSFL